MRWLFSTIAVLALFVAGCKKNPADQVTDVAPDDPRMNVAMDKARATVDTFIAALKSPIVGQSDFSVKAPFTDGDKVEHFWITPVSFDGTNFEGTINNKPAKV